MSEISAWDAKNLSLKAHFEKSQLERPLQNCINPDYTNKSNIVPTIPDIEVTSPGIRKRLEKIDPRKATGPDNIQACQFLKTHAVEIADVFRTLFQASLNQGVVPPD